MTMEAKGKLKWKKNLSKQHSSRKKGKSKALSAGEINCLLMSHFDVIYSFGDLA